MTIDWFTVAAQIVNFLILLFLLHRFLYEPILRAMEERRERIALRLREAEEKEEKAETERERYERRHRELELESEALREKARNEAEVEKQRLLGEAREEVAEQKRRWEEALREEREGLLVDLRARLAERLTSGLRRILHEMADEELERRIVLSFLRRFGDVPEEELAPVREAGLDSGRVVVRHTLTLDEELRERLQTRLVERFGSLDVEFEAAPELVCGLEVRADGWRLDWNVEDVLRGIEEELLDVLVREERPGAEETPGERETALEKAE